MSTGSDPIPGFEDTIIWPTRYEAVGLALGLRSNTSTSVLVADSAVPGGVYLQTTTDGAIAAYEVTLGPQDSDWEMLIQYGKGSDFGKVDVYLSLLLDPGTDPERTLLVRTIDGYAASPSYVIDGSVDNQPNIIVAGAPGVRPTTYTPGVDQDFDGGPGYYEIAFKVNGKNASSSGYKMRLLAWSLQRRPLSGGALFPAIYPP